MTPHSQIIVLTGHLSRTFKYFYSVLQITWETFSVHLLEFLKTGLLLYVCTQSIYKLWWRPVIAWKSFIFVASYTMFGNVTFWAVSDISFSSPKVWWFAGKAKLHWVHKINYWAAHHSKECYLCKAVQPKPSGRVSHYLHHPNQFLDVPFIWLYLTFH